MKGYQRLQRIIGLHKQGYLSFEQARAQLLTGQGKLNRAAYNLAVEDGLCYVCSKHQRCIIKNCTTYTIKRGKNRGLCTFFEALKRKDWQNDR